MVKLTLGTYAAGTLIAFAATIVFAFQTRRQFYPAMVFLSSSTPAVMVLLNTLGLMVIASGKLVQFVFLGQLSSMEVQAVKDNAKYAFIETCLALTVFREELGFYAFSLFVLLFFSKVFHWIAVPRVESFGWRENASFWLHFRTWSLIGFLCLTDIMFSFTFARSIYLKKGPMFLMLFGFEYTILLFSIINLAFKYWILIQDLRLNGQWEMKSLYTFYVDIASDVIRLLLYLAFFSLISM